MAHPRGRSMVEVILAVVIIGFLTGFIIVLCIGNYFRAKQAMERQRQRRMSRFSTGGGAMDASPRSQYSSGGSTRTSEGENAADEKQHLLTRPPDLPRRRPNADDDGHDLLLFEVNQEDQKQQRRQPALVRV